MMLFLLFSNRKNASINGSSPARSSQNDSYQSTPGFNPNSARNGTKGSSGMISPRTLNSCAAAFSLSSPSNRCHLSGKFSRTHDTLLATVRLTQSVSPYIEVRYCSMTGVPSPLSQLKITPSGHIIREPSLCSQARIIKPREHFSSVQISAPTRFGIGFSCSKMAKLSRFPSRSLGDHSTQVRWYGERIMSMALSSELGRDLNTSLQANEMSCDS